MKVLGWFTSLRVKFKGVSKMKQHREFPEYTQEALLIIKETCATLNKAANRMKQTAKYIQGFFK